MSYYSSIGNCSPSAIRKPYLCNPCLTKEPGKVRHLFIYDADHEPLDPTSFSSYATLLSGGFGDLILNGNGSYDGGTTEEIDGFGDKAIENGNTTHVVEFQDPNWFENFDAYEYLKTTSDKKMIIFGAKYGRSTNAIVNISVKMPIDNNSKGFNVAVTTIKWESPNSPVPFLRPESLFTDCRVWQ